MTTSPTTTLPLARTPRTILCLGDSITGWSDLSRWLKWSHILEAMLEARCGVDAYRVLNHGIGGNTTADLLGRLQEDALAVRPDIVTLLISGNDAAPSSVITAQQTAANLDQIVARLIAVCPNVLILQYHLLVRSDHPQKAWRHLVANNGLLAQIAGKYSCPVLPMGPALEAAVNPALPTDNDAYRSFPPWAGTHGYRAKDLVGEDSVHTNNGGELVYGRAVFYKLVELGWVNTHPRLSLSAQRDRKCLHREDENSRNGRSTL